MENDFAIQNEVEPCELLLCLLGAFGWPYTLIFLVLSSRGRHGLSPLRCQGSEGLNLEISAPQFLWGIYFLTADSESLWVNLLGLFWTFSCLVLELVFNYSASSQSRISLNEVMRIKDRLKVNCTGNLLHTHVKQYCNVVPCPPAKKHSRNREFWDTQACSSLRSRVADISTTASY